MNRPSFRNLITTLLYIFSLLFLYQYALAANVNLAWDPNGESDLAGYKVYYGTASGTYGTPINVGNVTTYTLTGLTNGQTYFIAVTAYDTSNQESGFSNEVSGAAKDPETVSTPGVLSGPTSGTTGTSYSYTTGGSSSNLGHTVEYQFDWKGDASDLSLWGSATQSKTWASAGTYNVRSRARCTTHTTVVSNWSSSLSITISSAPQSYTITTNPSTLQITVDDVNYTAPQTFNWTPGATHKLSVSSPQNGTSGTRYVYSSWSDAGAQTHTVTIPSSGTTYTANFTTQYSLTTSASPSAGGSVSPSGTNWYNNAASVSVSATASAGYTFLNWSGDLSGSTSPTSIPMNGPKNVVANFETVSTPTVPSGPATGITNTSYTYTTGGSSSNLGHTVEYQFDWKGDASDLSLWGSATQSKTWASAGTYSVRSKARCTTHTTVVSNWSSSLSITISSAPQSYTITTNPSTLQITVDDVNYTAPQTFNWTPGAAHKLSVSSPQPRTPGTQYVYTSWSDAGAQTHSITAPSSSASYTANLKKQNKLKTSVNLAGAGTISVNGTVVNVSSSDSNYYDSDQTIPILATANAGYGFTGWSGDLSGTTNPTSIKMDIPKDVTANFTAIPGAATLMSPSGEIFTGTPTYSWNAVTGATWYRLKVSDSTGNKIHQWYAAAAVGCPDGTANCSVTPTISLAPGAGQWSVQTYNIGGYGPWSSTMSFTASLPGAATLVSPSGTITTTTPTYVWNAVSSSTWYCLYVNDSTGNKMQRWYTAAAVGCGSGTGTCSVTPTTEVGGSCRSYIRTYNAVGLGSWSSPLSFTVPPPGPATLVSPSGTITNTTPTYNWNAVSNATWYQLYVNDSTGNKIQKWYSAAAAGCASGTGTCSVTPTTEVGGSCQWWVKTYNIAGFGPSSAPLSFTVPPPPAATLVSPSGTISDTRPTYTWNAVSNSTWYQLKVNDSKGNKIQQWYSAAAAGCASGTGTCSIASTTEVLGSCEWYIRTYNAAGYGPWSAPLSFTTPIPTPPPAATLVSPSGTITTNTPTYTWNAVSNSTWYCLNVNDSTGNKINQWYTAAAAGCGSGTGTCSVTPTTEVIGSCTWSIRTYNSGGYGPWSAPLSFTTPFTPPRAATLVSPSGTITTYTPTYIWNAVSNSTSYCLYVTDPVGNKIHQWYTASAAGCASGTGTCSVTPNTALARGTSQWSIQTYNAGGYGPLSAPLLFNVF